jgi:CrcB protein
MIKNLLFVATGGALGSVLRYLISTNLHKAYPSAYPYGTFAVNVLGCLLIGLLMGWLGSQKLVNPQLQLLLIAGFCGSFTTFSTFAYEANILLLQQKPLQSILYITLSIVMGMTLAYLGYRLTKG